MKRKERTTILFVNKGARVSKPLHVSSNLIWNWKKYLAGLSLFFLSLIGIIVYLIINNIRQYQSQKILSQKFYALSAQIDTNALRKKLSYIDDQLSSINGFLNARGIKSAYKMPQGINADSNFSVNDMTDFYETYLNRVSYNISYTPLGLPYRGPITSSFGKRENPFGGDNEEIHKGLDIKGPMGGEVKAMAKGEVEFAGQKSGFGNCIVLKHGNGFETLYGHLSKILVKVGDQIDIGERIGLIGSTGRSTGPHLHYEVHRYGKKIDPESFLNLN
jgi:murein DD-endopeptidase MepM/ murein hydrolase activator NlpD